MKYSPTADRFFAIMGNSYFALYPNTLLAGTPSMIRVTGRPSGIGELYLAPEDSYDCFDKESGWHWHLADSQSFLEDFDFDDRNIQYLAYGAQGWGMLQYAAGELTYIWDSNDPANPEGESCSGVGCTAPAEIHAVRSGTTYYAIVGSSGQWGVWDVTTPTAPAFLGSWSNLLRLARNESGTLLAGANRSSTGRLILPADFATGQFTGTPVGLSTSFKYWTVVPDGNEFWFLPEDASASPIIYRVTSTGVATAFPVTLSAAQGFFYGRAGAGYLFGTDLGLVRTTGFKIGSSTLTQVTGITDLANDYYYSLGNTEIKQPGILPIERDGKIYFVWSAGALGDVYEAGAPDHILTIGDSSAAEGDSGTTSATFDVTLSAASTSTVTVSYATSGNTATSGVDFVSTSGSLTFVPGDTVESLTVDHIGDTLDESNEQYYVQLSNASGAIITDATAVGTITDDDASPSLSIADASTDEGSSGTKQVEVTVTLSAASNLQVTVNWSTVADGTATAAQDFTSASDSLTFGVGETSKKFYVQIIGDVTPEADETFSVTLSGAVNATIGDGTGTVTILDDEVKPPASVTATASAGTSVSLIWPIAVKAASYKVYRSTLGSSYVEIGTTSSTAYVDTTAVAGKAYLYSVKSVDAGGFISIFSPPDVATTMFFTDPTIVAGVTVPKAAHLTELRTAVDLVSALASMSTGNYTDPTLEPGTTIKQVHIAELRERLGGARVALGLTVAVYTDPTITPGTTPIKAAHITDLRNAVK